MSQATLQDRKVILEVNDLKVYFDVQDNKQWFWQPKKASKPLMALPYVYTKVKP